MAILISTADGNFTGSTTFATASTDGQQLSLSGNGNTSTSATASPTFAITAGQVIDGVVLNLRNNTSSGTLTVQLFDGTSVVASTTINAADFPQSGDYRYLFFKFSSTYTVPGGITAASIRILSSAGASCTLQRSATANDWFRILRTTTTATRAAADVIYIVGEKSSAGVGTTRTVTMNETSSATVPGAMTIGQDGVLTWGTSASTNYYLRVGGNLTVAVGGTMNIGTTGTPMPSTSTAVLELNSTTAGQYGITVTNAGTLNVCGNALTIWKTKLAADLSSAATTTWTTSSQLSAKSGDEIMLVSTSRTAGDTCKRTLASDVTGSSVTVTAGPAASAYSGSIVSGFDTRATIWVCTRNVKIRGVGSATGNAYLIANGTSACDIRWCEFSNLGGTGNAGVDSQTTSGGSFYFRYNAIHSTSTSNQTKALNLAGTTGSSVEIRDSLITTAGLSANGGALQVAATSGVPIIDNCLFLQSNSNVAVVTLLDIGLTFTSNEVAAGGGGSSAGCLRLAEADAVLGTFSGNSIHCAAANGGLVIASRITSGTISSCQFWRSSAIGLSINAMTQNVTFDTCQFFGNAGNGGIDVTAGNAFVASLFTGCTFDGGITSGGSFTSARGLSVANGATVADVYFETCTFGSTVAHTTADILVGVSYVNITLRATTLSSTTEVSGQSSMVDGPRSTSYISSQKHDNTAGSHRSWFSGGTISVDSTIYSTASPSARMTPNSSANKLSLNVIRVPVVSGTAATVSIKVRKSVAGDGTAYNGNQPRLIVQATPSAGIASDTVLATADASSDGAFATLSGTTATVTDDAVLDIIVDCDGTLGWVNVDDASVS